MARRGSLDTMFSELIQEDKDDTTIEVCLEQLARAISAHVTDILIERLGLEERIAQTNSSNETTKESSKIMTSSMSPRSDVDALHVKQSGSRSLSTPRSLPQSPTPCPRSRLPRRQRDNHKCNSTENVQEPEEMSSCSRYHSENRLNRIEPPPDLNETPLENRASRLRRANAQKKTSQSRWFNGFPTGNRSLNTSKFFQTYQPYENLFFVWIMSC
ncbi:hypothetical protein COOONC_07287 [Cooperia oncophora]